MEVQILSRKLIKPSSRTPPHLRRLKLSPIDRLGPQGYVPTILFDPANGGAGISSSSRAENDERRGHLEKSLSEILTHFYPLAGRLIKEDESVDCNDQGVEYLDAKVDIHLNQFLSRRRDAIEQMNSLTQFDFSVVGSVTCPLVVIQTTLFECGGLAIGIRICHTIADGFTMVKFITAWATASQVGTKELLLPCFNLASLFPAKVLPMLNPPPPRRVFGFDKVVTRLFLFNGAQISILKTKSSPGSCDVGVKQKPSRVEVVTAVIWKALIRVSEAKYGRLRTSLAVHSVNLRDKIVPVVPDNCYENLYRLVAARFTGDKGKMELPDLVVLLRDAISANALCRREDVFPTVIKSFNEVNEESSKEDVDVHMFSSWCRFPTNEADFGWGKPTWVSKCNAPFPVVSLRDAESGDGIEAWVSLSKEDMLLFQQDEDIIAFGSSGTPFTASGLNSPMAAGN